MQKIRTIFYLLVHKLFASKTKKLSLLVFCLFSKKISMSKLMYFMRFISHSIGLEIRERIFSRNAENAFMWRQLRFVLRKLSQDSIENGKHFSNPKVIYVVVYSCNVVTVVQLLFCYQYCSYLIMMWIFFIIHTSNCSFSTTLYSGYCLILHIRIEVAQLRLFLWCT